MSRIESVGGMEAGVSIVSMSHSTLGFGDVSIKSDGQERVVTVLEKRSVQEDVFGGKIFSKKQVDDAIEQANTEMKKLETNLRFSIHEKTKRILVKIVDSHTEEVIREIPPEKLLDMCAFMMEKAGLLVDRRG